jgi:hypothetical protein
MLNTPPWRVNTRSGLSGGIFVRKRCKSERFCHRAEKPETEREHCGAPRAQRALEAV